VELVEPNHPALRRKSLTIFEDTDLFEIISGMEDILSKTPNAVGLAAPQVGLNIKLFITYAPEPTGREKRVFINPKIVKKLGSVTSEVEGCLSLPAILVDVLRHEKILIEYYDRYWVKRKEVFSGMVARVIQHEQDHLNGKLITDYM